MGSKLLFKFRIKSTVVDSNGSGSLKTVFAGLFGGKSITSLIDVDFTVDVIPHRPSTIPEPKAELEPNGSQCLSQNTSEHSSQPELSQLGREPAYTITVRGLVSRPSPFCGRSDTDRQFLYINGKPIDVPRLFKAINAVYRDFNKQYPVYVLQLDIPQGTRGSNDR
jgi:DNA mismatch repair ATPase MutL